MESNRAVSEQDEIMETQSMVVCGLSVLGLLAGMIASLFFVGPSGQRMDLTGFLMLWFREILLVGPLVLMIIVAIPVMLWRSIKLCWMRLKRWC